MSKRNPTIREMVEHRLRADGFDGLWQCGGECDFRIEKEDPNA